VTISRMTALGCLEHGRASVAAGLHGLTSLLPWAGSAFYPFCARKLVEAWSDAGQPKTQAGVLAVYDSVIEHLRRTT